MENTIQAITHFQLLEQQTKKNQLSNFLNPDTRKLDIDKYGLYLVDKFKEQPFFKRFPGEALKKYLAHAELITFQKNEIIYLKGRVGVIYYGSVKIVSHSQGMLTPFTEVRHHRGKTIGHKSDNGISTSSQNWLFCYDEGTELLFFEPEIFDELWHMQMVESDKQIIEANIECNKLLHCLSDQSQFQIIYEDL